MEQLFDPTSLYKLFNPNLPLIETFLRGTVVYLALFTIMRFLVKKGAVASASMTDLLVLVLVTNAVQNAIIDDSDTITDGILVVLVVVLWSYAIDWLSLHWRSIRLFAYPRPIKIIEDGEPIWENVRNELITEEQLYSMVRQQGLEDVSEVKEARVEPNGYVSIVPFNGQ